MRKTRRINFGLLAIIAAVALIIGFIVIEANKRGEARRAVEKLSEAFAPRYMEAVMLPDTLADDEKVRELAAQEGPEALAEYPAFQEALEQAWDTLAPYYGSSEIHREMLLEQLQDGWIRILMMSAEQPNVDYTSLMVTTNPQRQSDDEMIGMLYIMAKAPGEADRDFVPWDMRWIREDDGWKINGVSQRLIEDFYGTEDRSSYPVFNEEDVEYVG